MAKRRRGPKEWSPRGQVPGEPVWPEFVDAYLEAALWASLDEEGNPLDCPPYSRHEWAQSAVNRAVRESNDFIRANLADLESVGRKAQHGHDFWLTRNHHGAGFWDRGYGAVGKRLTDAAHAYGELHVWAGDDGKFYFE